MIFHFLQGSESSTNRRTSILSTLKKSTPENHHGPKEKVPLLRHLRAAHNLFGYTPDNQSFKTKTSSKLWAGGKFHEWRVQYKLFKRFGIVNTMLLRENAKRASHRERGEALDGEGKKRKKGKEISLIVVIAD